MKTAEIDSLRIEASPTRRNTNGGSMSAPVKPLINLVIPVYNEERILAQTVEIVVGFLNTRTKYNYELVIADNGSTDRTAEIAQGLRTRFPNLQVLSLSQKGRGHALYHAWTQSSADVLSYMDADLSTDLEAFVPLVDALISHGYDVATGSRLISGASTKRGFRRELISRGYNGIVKALFANQFTDAQCGFKALTRRAAQKLLPLTEDRGWFLDTELLLLAEFLGMRVLDIPVRWMERRDSKVEILSAAWRDIRGLHRLRKRMRCLGKSGVPAT
jgi:glycosyltransferase involved in cell wall biosynthesis